DLYQLISSNGSFGSTVTSCTDATAGSSYSFSQSYDSIHNIRNKTQTAMQNSAVNPQTTYNNTYTYPAPGSPHPHSPTAIGEFNLTTDANGNQITTQDTGTKSVNQYLFDEENRLSCTNKGPQMPSPSCIGTNLIDFIYDHAGVRKIKSAATPTIYPNEYYTDFGGGSGNQFKHFFIGSERILTKKTRIAPDREHWYYHGDQLHSTAMVTNQKSQLVDALHYFPFGEVWFEERPSSLPPDYFCTAKEFDPETGFYDFGARYLDPRFSKWMTADPADRIGASTPIIALNPYQYGRHNPARFFDPDGAEERESKYTGFSNGFDAGLSYYTIAAYGGAPLPEPIIDQTKKGNWSFWFGAQVGNIFGAIGHYGNSGGSIPAVRIRPTVGVRPTVGATVRAPTGADLQRFRQKLGVPTRDTVAVGTVDVE